MKASKKIVHTHRLKRNLFKKKQNTEELRCFEFSSKLNAERIEYFKRIGIVIGF